MTVFRSIQPLLEKATEVVQRHRVQAHKQGLSFNLFDVLGLTTEEVSGHSAFIAALLDPKGSHGQQDMFLQHFLQILLEADPTLVGQVMRVSGEWRVEVERRFIGQADKPSGRIDILLENGDLWVIIENKIYAGDQNAQLERYATYASRSHKCLILIYLTLDGREPNAYTLGNLKADQVVCLGYGAAMERWLTRCIESAVQLPPIRESLAQYQRLVRRLSGGGNLKELTMELSQQLLTPENLEAAQEIARAVPKAKEYVLLEFWKDLRKAFLRRDAEPKELIGGFTPTQEVIRTSYAPRRGYGGFGWCFPLVDITQTRQLALVVATYNTLYLGVVAIDNLARATLSSKERTVIREVLDKECPQYRLETKPGDLSEWVYPKHRLDFKEFGPPCLALADSLARQRTADAIADETIILRQALGAGLPPAMDGQRNGLGT